MTTLRSRAVPTIIEALRSKALFAQMFDAPSWRPWLVFLKALFALPLTTVELAIYRQHTGRLTLPLKAFREACLVCGRRGGKSRILALIGVYLAAVLDCSAYLAPGETPVVAIIAADRKQARVILGYVSGLLQAVPALAAMIVDELAESIVLANGVSIEIHTGSVGAPRGRTFIAVLADEIAFWGTGDVANPDREIIAAVRPGLSTIPKSILLIASSPYARRGVLFETFSRYWGKDHAPVLVWRGTTQEMNAGIDPRIIQEAYEADPESAAAEYGAEFRTDITAFIGRDAIEAVVAVGIVELPTAAGIPYSAFVDPSGGSADSMTLAIGHMDSAGIAVLDVVRERKPPFSPEDVTEEFCTLLRSYGITRVSGDAYAGEWPRERFATHGIAYELAGRNKNAIYQDFLPALNGRRIRLLDQPRLIAQLCNLERRVSRGGRDSIDHGPGQHDDVANAVCGLLTSVINDRRPSLIRPGAMESGNEPTPIPSWATSLFATMVIAQDGMAATAYFAHHDVNLQLPEIAPLTLVDFTYEPLSTEAAPAMRDRILALRSEIKGVVACLGWVQEAYRQHAHLHGIPVRSYPAEVLSDLPGLAISAAGHVNARRFRIAAPAVAKEKSIPLMGMLSFRPGEDIDANPLRVAVLLGIELALSPERSRTSAVPANEEEAA